MNWLLDHGVNVATLLAVLGVGWRINLSLTKLHYDLLNFRLHAHGEGEGEILTEKGIRYPA